jgi:hypothetical protein
MTYALASDIHHHETHFKLFDRGTGDVVGRYVCVPMAMSEPIVHLGQTFEAVYTPAFHTRVALQHSGRTLATGGTRWLQLARYELAMGSARYLLRRSWGWPPHGEAQEPDLLVGRSLEELPSEVPSRIYLRCTLPEELRLTALVLVAREWIGGFFGRQTATCGGHWTIQRV